LSINWAELSFSRPPPKHYNIIIETGFRELIIQVATAFEWAVATVVGGFEIVERMNKDSCLLVKA
jgi:hypothetical protein